MVRPRVDPSVGVAKGALLGSGGTAELPQASHMPSPGGSRLQADVGHRLPYGQQDLDIGEWRGHGCDTRPVAVLHRDLSEGRPALPVGAQLQRHGLGTGAGELGEGRTGEKTRLEPSCPATPHTLQPHCPCHATRHSTDLTALPRTPQGLFVDERLCYNTSPAEGRRVPHSNKVLGTGASCQVLGSDLF